MTLRVVTAGLPEPMGVSLTDGGINIAVFSAHATAIELCLFDEAGEIEVERILLPARTFDVFHAEIAGIDIGARYGLRAYGPWAPDQGHRFNPTKLLIDPYAQRLDRAFKLHPSMFDWPPGTQMGAAPNQDDSAPFMPKAIVEAPDDAIALPPLSWQRQVIYEMHVRGFSKLRQDVPESLRGTYAALRETPLLSYLSDLNIGAVEFLPSSAWLEERHLPPLGLTNYWGYNPVTYMAPDFRLAPGGFAEIRATTDALRARGIASLLDVVFNHTGEGDVMGPTVSFRGLDHRSYYRFVPGQPGVLVNDTGCGNTLAADHPVVLRMIMDSMRLWVRRAGLSGYRFDLASTIARNPGTYDPRAPFLQAVAQDPALRGIAMIAEPWDIGMGGYQVGAFPAPWGEWNDKYRDTMRRFWRGDGWMLGETTTRFAGSSDIYGQTAHAPSRSINFITAHDGFTLADLVSYASKHNDANGEHNRDGTGENQSWNHGVEGPTGDESVRLARQADIRALLATLLLSRGTPMLAAGDELGRTQQGNNNAYAQDTPISWVEWQDADPALAHYTAKLIAARRSCPALTSLAHLTGEPADDTLRPDVVWRRADGEGMRGEDWQNGEARTLIADLYQPDVSGGSRALVVLHAGWSSFLLTLPENRPGFAWRRVIDSAQPEAESVVAAQTLHVEARTALLLIEEPSLTVANILPAESLALAARDPAGRLATLADAAGLAPNWWDIAGNLHHVPDDSRRALLRAMKLPADSTADIAESLYSLANLRDFAALPPSVVVREGQGITLTLGPALATLPRAIALVLLRQDGSRARFVVPPDDTGLAQVTAADGRVGRVRHVFLPPQPIGRHRLVCVDQAAHGETKLTVAPQRCYLPPELTNGGRRFGLATHLYSLRRAGDQGIGDFTTLAEVGRETAAGGGAIVGLNPLHALFPEHRGLVSPYSPSDRRFLEPLYVDVAQLPFITELPGVQAALAAEAGAFAALRDTRAVDYAGVWAAKDRVLRAAFKALNALPQSHPAAEALASFRAQGGRGLDRFATFQAISATYPDSTWKNWPVTLHDPASVAVQDFAAGHTESVSFFAFLQWLADHQLASADVAGRAAGLSLGFYRDLAVGTAPVGAEAWSEQDFLMTGVSVGAPPDPFSIEGQNWNLPPPNPWAMRGQGYEGFGELLRANMRHAGALRIDHVLGLNRLFLIPEGGKAAEGAYLAYPLQDMLGVTALESQAARCLVVGEDLGTVPDGVREAMASAGLLAYRVFWFEREGAGFKPPAAYPSLAAACVSTHDLPTLAGWWQGADIIERQHLHLSDDAATAHALTQRDEEKRIALAALAAQGLLEHAESIDLIAPMPDAVVAAFHAYIGRTASVLDLVQADDLGRETEALNLPGTDQERPNWQRKIMRPAADLWQGALGDMIRAKLADRSNTTA
ncbi:glycogen debranching protein GlgX [Acidisoma cellulosilytica]|uniref:4-alpha-glucanotransferase n=1 Tax=Acidisoma cellulosilyticum TaxID=2802395 RepID=A0A963YXN3_9PROT|nr:glycogen debranching protein GlgX [Acidisoma cellulosilyticum]MCB8878739.1 glycogen debranching protein GlgX [Acidisoma cellulosilyticum]